MKSIKNSFISFFFALFAIFEAASVLGAPSVSVTSVRQRYPWNGKVDIEYTVNGTDASQTVTLSVTDRATGRTYTPSHITGPLSGSAGSHRVTWDTVADGLNCISSDLIVNLTLHSPKYMVIDLSGGTGANSFPVSYLSDVPSGGWADVYKTTKLVLRRIDAGTFTLGDQVHGYSKYSNIKITKPYYIGVFEVTQKQWELVMGNNPSTVKAHYESRPVEMISYDMVRGASNGAGWPDPKTVDSSSFLGVLRAKTGVTELDLPTETQWEYAAKAGTSNDYGNGTNYSNMEQDSNMDAVGRYGYNSGFLPGENELFDDEPLTRATAKVGSYAANNWGLYDMHGNVMEWCLDWFGEGYFRSGMQDPEGPGSGTDRVLRGGSWADVAVWCAAFGRTSMSPSFKDSRTGFRLASRSAEIRNVTSAPWSLDTRVETETPEVKNGSMDIVWSGLWNGNASSKVSLKAVLGSSTSTLVSKQTGSGIYAWHPTAYGTYTLRLESDSGQLLLSKTVYYPEPSGVSNVKAQQRYPWNGLVDIDYTLSGDTSGLAVQITVTDRKTGKIYYAQHFQTSPDASPGTHRATWNTDADGINCVSDNIIATVSLVEPTYMVIDLSGDTGASLYPVSYFAGEPSGGWNSDVYKTTKLVLRKIIPGTFDMGDQVHGGAVARNITLTKPYYVGVFPVTQRQWELVMGSKPSYFQNSAVYAARPVERVSYDMIRGLSAGAGWPPSTDVDTGSFLAVLRAKTGIDFDLPTEAQWEYAARSGTTTDYGNGTNYGNSTTDSNMGAVGRYMGNSGTSSYNSDASVGTAKVGTYAPNNWGLYDMHGNVWEWCLDWAGTPTSGGIDPEGAATGSTNLRVLRGGSFSENAGKCTSFVRSGATSSTQNSVVGFRLSYTVPAASASANSAQWSLDTRADGIDPLEIGDSIDIVWDSSWFGPNQTVKITYGSTVLLWESGSGVFPWTLPADLHGDFTLELVYNNGAAALTRTVRRSETLAITSVSARQRYPWNNLVDIDYTVRGNASGLIPKLIVTDRDSGRVYTPTNYTGTLSTAAGSHRITWNTTADGLNLLSDKLVATISFEEPLYMVIDISGGPSAISYPVSYLSDIPNGAWADTYKSDKIVLRKIQPEGTFKLRDQYNGITISKPYFAGVFEVTQKQWELVMGSNPSVFHDSSVSGCQFRPVECVSYNMIRGSSNGAGWPSDNTVDSVSFMGILRQKTGLEALDLPTDAQWEYAARSGTNTHYGNGTNYVNGEQDSNMDVVGRYAYNSGYSDHSYSFALATATAKVGSYAPNKWGLYDMHGNVWEWCLDWMGNYANKQTDPKGPDQDQGRGRVVAGGSWIYAAYACTSYTRMGVPPDTDDQVDIGFRLFCGTELAKASADSDPWTLDSRAGGSEPLEVSGSMNIVWSSLWNGNASSKVTLKANRETFADDLSGEGTYAWSPSEYGVITLSMYTAGVTAPLTRTISNPEPLNVSGVVAKQRYPWNGLVDIDYRVGGDPGSLTLNISVTDQKSGTTYTPSTFTVAPGKTTGTHRATWNAAADIADSCISDDMVVTVSLSDSSGVQATFTSQPWSLDTRAGDSPMRVTDSIDIAYSTRWFGNATKVTIQIDETNLVANLSGEGSVAWTPPCGLFALKLLPDVGNPLTVTIKNPEPPSVSSVSAKQRYPWNGLVDIDYTVRGENDDRTLQITVTDRAAGGTTYTPTTFVLAPGKTSGTHHAVWDAKADIPSCISESMFVIIALVENQETVASSTSLAWSLDTRAGDSPMLVTDSIDVAYGTRWFDNATKVDFRIDGTNFVANLTGEGSVAWTPTSYGKFVFTLVPNAGDSLTVTIKNPEPPTLSSISAHQRYPWNGMVDIDYEVGGDTERQTLAVSVTDRDTGTVYTPTNLLGSASVDVGTHRITWNTAADGVSCISTNMVVSMSLVSGNDVFATGDSAPWSLDTRAGTETLEIEDSMTVAWSSLWYGDATSTVTVSTNGAVLAENLVGEGAFEWVPPAPGDYDFTLATEGANETLTAQIWVPGPSSVTVDAVKQRFPWNGKVDIDYTVGGRRGDFDVQFSITDRTSGTTYTHVDVEGTASGERGAYRVTWDAKTAGFSTNMSVTATLVRAGTSDAVSSGSFTPWRLDTRDLVVLPKGESLDITYSDTAWGGSVQTAASVSTNGAVLSGNLSGTSSIAWTPAKLGVYTLQHTPGDFTAAVKVVETTGVLIDGVDIGETFAGNNWNYDGDTLVVTASGIVVNKAASLSQDDFDAFMASKAKCEPAELYAFEKQGDGSYKVVAAGIPYIDENGLERQCTEYIVMTKNIATFEDGEWYVVPTGVDVSRAEITVSGSAHLILCDGSKLTLSGDADKAGIRVAAGTSLTIYGQSGGTGFLQATGGDSGAGIGGNSGEAGGTVAVYGGMVAANGAAGCAGIGAGAGQSGHGALTVADALVVKVDDFIPPTTEKPHGAGGAIALGGEQYYRISMPLALEIVSAKQRWPWNGKVDIVVTASHIDPTTPYMLKVKLLDGETAYTYSTGIRLLGLTSANGLAVVVDADDAARWDTPPPAKLFAAPKLQPVLAEEGVQLWAGGPCWSECNVGASMPEEFGYYFSWGDTVGYKRAGGNWDDLEKRYSKVTWVSSTGESMGASPFSSSTCSTWGMDNSNLQSQGYIDSTGNLAAKHDAATTHIGAPWRMPTDAEFADLADEGKTSIEMTDDYKGTGVAGLIISGKDDYAGNSIFLPIAGSCNDSYLYGIGSFCYYWSSTPMPGNAWQARLQALSLTIFNLSSGVRYFGQPVRPVRELAGTCASGSAGSNVEYAGAEFSLSRLDTRAEIVFEKTGESLPAVPLTYSETGWGASPESASAEILVDDASLVGGYEGGTRSYAPDRIGEYTFTHNPGGYTAKIKWVETTHVQIGGVDIGWALAGEGWSYDGSDLVISRAGIVVTHDSSMSASDFDAFIAERFKSSTADLYRMEKQTDGSYKSVRIPMSVEIVSAKQRWPWNGKVDVVVNAVHLDPAMLYTIKIKLIDGETAYTYLTGILLSGVTGTNGLSFVVDADKSACWNARPPRKSFDAPKLQPVLAEVLFGVQLWENGPYWAECNVGATSPEDYGSYFWWGDTGGYKYDNDSYVWKSVKNGRDFTFKSSNCPTDNKGDSTLLSEGYIDATGNLVAAHDAATANLGAPWRMPTYAEFGNLLDNDKTSRTWTGNYEGTGVSGYIVTGKGDYAEKSIFLPTAGYGTSYYCYSYGQSGYYWTSAPYSSGKSYFAWYLNIGSDRFARTTISRYFGLPVRPLRESAWAGASTGADAVAVHTGAEFTDFTLDTRYEIVFEKTGEALPSAPLTYSETGWGADSGSTSAEILVNGENIGGEYAGNTKEYVPDKLGEYTFRHNPGGCSATIKWIETTHVQIGNKDIGHTFSGEGWSYDGSDLVVSRVGIVVTHDETMSPDDFDAFIAERFKSTPAGLFQVEKQLDGTYASVRIPPSVEILSAKQRWPWNGKVDVVVNAAHLDPAAPNTVKIKLIDGETAYTYSTGVMFSGVTATNGLAVVVDADDAAGWDMSPPAKLFVAPKLQPVLAEMDIGGVQLWENGPYWAECNVGATRPEEYGYYFLWGATVGYRRNANDDGWISVDGSTSIEFSDEDNTANAALYMSFKNLVGGKWIDEVTHDLVAEHDAATVHLGAPWRMPTYEDFAGLADFAKISRTWTDDYNGTGVAGFIISGRNDYAGKSIFVPAAGLGSGADLIASGSANCLWSSTLDSVDSRLACCLDYNGNYFAPTFSFRFLGMTVRPVRGSAVTCVPAGSGSAAEFIGAEFLIPLLDIRDEITIGPSDGELSLDRVPPVWNDTCETVSVANATTGGAAVSWSDADHAWVPNPGGVYEFTKGNESATVTVAVSLFPNAVPPTAVSGLVYDGNEHRLVQGGVLAVLSGGSETQTNAGGATLLYTPAPGYSWSDGTAAEQSVDVSIAKKALTIKAWDNAITYGQAPAGNGVFDKNSAFIEGEGLDDLGGAPGYDFTYVQYGDVGEYAITPKGYTSDNYAITYETGKLTVKPKTLTVDGLAATTRVYDGTTAVSLTGGALNGIENNDDVTATMPTAGSVATATAGANKPVSFADIVLTGTKVGNYTLTQPVVTATISKKALTITADDKDCVMGQEPPAFTYVASGFIAGEDESMLKSGPQFSCDYSAQTRFHAVSMDFDITPYGADAVNYAITYVPGTLSVLGLVDVTYVGLGGQFADGSETSVVTTSVVDGYAFPEVTRPGYVLDGWYTSWANGAAAVSAGGKLVSYADHTVYAKWVSATMAAGRGGDYMAGKDLDSGAAFAVTGSSATLPGTDFAIPERIVNGSDGKFITRIGKDAYSKANYDDKVSAGKQLTSVSIPVYMTLIGDNAFYGCTSMSNVTFTTTRNYRTNEKTKLTIGSNAFAGIAAETIVFPAGSAVKLGAGSFARCPNLKEIFILGELEGIEKGAFALSGNGGEITVHLSPEYAADAGFIANLTKDMNSSNVKLDITLPDEVEFTSVSVNGNMREVKFKFGSEASPGAVNVNTVSLLYTYSLKDGFADPGNVIKPQTVEGPDADGNYTATFEKPAGGGGSEFYRLVIH